MVIVPAVAPHSQSNPETLSLSSKRESNVIQPPLTILKDNKQWDSVKRTLNAQINYQDVADILDPHYVPKTKEDIFLFDEKQKYM